jgi:TetR/AcrR family transcriptional regulator, upper aerobic nicotinate degradation pathway regulator
MAGIRRKNVTWSPAVVAGAERGTGADAGASTGRDKRADKVKALLSAALDLFDSRHFADVSTKEIATAAGMNSAMLYYYFEDKEELFRSVVEMAVQAALQQFRELQDSAKSPKDIISGWLETHVRQFDIIRKFVKISINYRSSGAHSDTIDAAITHFYETEKTVLTSAIQAGIKEGNCDAVEADRVASLISTFLDGIMVRSIIFPNLDFTGEIWRFNVLIHKYLNWRV